MKDTCLFPLALPMDGSDVFKGASTWESIGLLSECVLAKWEENSRKNSKVTNKVLIDATKYLYPNADLEASLIQNANAYLPLRRTKSEIDLSKLGLHERKGLFAYGKRQNQTTRKAKAVDDIHVNVGNEKGRSRAHTSLSLRKNSVHFSASKERKDKFDLKIDRNLKSDAKSLVQSIKIESPMSLALQITKIEKDLMLNLEVEEVMSVVINKGKRDAKRGLHRLLEYGKELSQLVADIIVKEATFEAQGKKIAALIEVII